MKKICCILLALLSSVTCNAVSALIITNIQAEQISCDGTTRPEALIGLFAQGGESPYAFFLDDNPIPVSEGDQVSHFYRLSDLGEHTFRIRDGSGQSQQATITVGPSSITNLVSNNMVTPCSGQSDGELRVVAHPQQFRTVLTKPDGSTIERLGVDGVATFSVLSAGHYMTETFDISGGPTCGSTKAEIDLVDASPLVITDVRTTNQTPTTGGSITVLADGGSGLLLYILNDTIIQKGSENTFIGLDAGTYKVTVAESATPASCQVSQDGIVVGFREPSPLYGFFQKFCNV